ncbi:MAG TPA: hypothetical protein VFZ59_05740 [Verrucomicrobiae bacterium]|nr:hypothetical protein [Verrucomicrobiae bacterium]
MPRNPGLDDAAPLGQASRTKADRSAVEALLRQCDALEAQLRQTRTLGAHLLDPPSTTSSPHQDEVRLVIIGVYAAKN